MISQKALEPVPELNQMFQKGTLLNAEDVEFTILIFFDVLEQIQIKIFITINSMLFGYGNLQIS